MLPRLGIVKYTDATMGTPRMDRATLRFGAYELDLQGGVLRKDGIRLHCQEQPLQVLAALAERPSELVTREELRRRVWPQDTFVDFDHALNTAVKKIRATLNDDADAPRYIETVPRRGYRFVAQVDREAVSSPALGPLVQADHLQANHRSRGVAKPNVLGHYPLRTALVLLGAAVIAGLVFTTHIARLHLKSASRNGRVMLAVLPFRNLNNDPEQDYFSDGLTEETITDLGALSPGKLGVIARTSTMAYKQSNKTVGQIGQELGVDYILEGSARRDARRVRISTQLIRVKDQTHVWAHSYDRDIVDFLEVQSELGAAIAQQVQVTLTPEQGMGGKKFRVDQEAYDDYLKGRFLWNKFTTEGVNKSIEFYQQALEKDPGYAPAYAGLSESYYSLMDFSVLPPNEAYPKGELAARKAVELDSGNSQAHSALGSQLLWYARDFVGAERELRRAIELNPSNSDAHDGYASYFAVRGKFDQSVAEMRKARDVDPLSLIINSDLGYMLFYARQYDQAIQQLHTTLSLDPDFPAAHYFLIKIYQALGMYEEAYEEFFKLQTPGGQIPPAMVEIQKIHARSGWKGVWQNMLAMALQERSTGKFVSAYDIAETYLGLGDDEQTLAWLQKAADEHANQVIYLNVDPRFDRLHSNPRFQDLLRHIGSSPQ